MNDLQILFDYSAEGILDQGRKSRYPRLETTSGCQYAISDGLHCAVGFLLTEAGCAKADRLGLSPCSINLSDFKPELREAVRGSKPQDTSLPAVELMDDLQSIHDSHPVSDWVGLLWKLAVKHDLDPGILVTWIGEEEDRK